MAIKGEQLSQELMNQFTLYTADIVEGINAAGKRSARAGVEALLSTSPQRSGKYRRGWSIKEEEGRGGVLRFILHNKQRPWLTHLLEHGHATRDGGRTKAQPHIDPAGEKIAADFLAAVEEVIKRGS
ncbi:MAG: HK97 gp10 family phage protein [bacterium]|nr:HK97 gp10 family phage protein [bacterium]